MVYVATINNEFMLIISFHIVLQENDESDQLITKCKKIFFSTDDNLIHDLIAKKKGSF